MADVLGSDVPIVARIGAGVAGTLSSNVPIVVELGPCAAEIYSKAQTVV